MRNYLGQFGHTIVNRNDNYGLVVPGRIALEVELDTSSTNTIAKVKKSHIAETFLGVRTYRPYTEQTLDLNAGNIPTDDAEFLSWYLGPKGKELTFIAAHRSSDSIYEANNGMLSSWERTYLMNEPYQISSLAFDSEIEFTPNITLNNDEDGTLWRKQPKGQWGNGPDCFEYSTFEWDTSSKDKRLARDSGIAQNGTRALSTSSPVENISWGKNGYHAYSNADAQWDLSTAFDWSTATLNDFVGYSPDWLHFTQDGTKAIEYDFYGDSLIIHELSTPFSCVSETGTTTYTPSFTKPTIEYALNL